MTVLCYVSKDDYSKCKCMQIHSSKKNKWWAIFQQGEASEQLNSSLILTYRLLFLLLKYYRAAVCHFRNPLISIPIPTCLTSQCRVDTKHKNQLRTWFHILCMNTEWGWLHYSWNPSKPVLSTWKCGWARLLFFSIMQQCESKFYFPWVDCHFKWAHRSC